MIIHDLDKCLFDKYPATALRPTQLPRIMQKGHKGAYSALDEGRNAAPFKKYNGHKKVFKILSRFWEYWGYIFAVFEINLSLFFYFIDIMSQKNLFFCDFSSVYINKKVPGRQ